MTVAQLHHLQETDIKILTPMTVESTPSGSFSDIMGLRSMIR